MPFWIWRVDVHKAWIRLFDVFIGLLEARFIILLAVLWFDVALHGGLGTLYLGLALFPLSPVEIGLTISVTCVTQQEGVLGLAGLPVPGDGGDSVQHRHTNTKGVFIGVLSKP